MDDIETRLREATDNCLKARETWRTDQRNTEAREKLMESVHELRKIAARLEIEIAISERDEMSSRPIPIPPHRSARKREGAEGMEEEDNGFGNRSEGPSGPPPQGGFSSGGSSGGVEVSRMGGGRRHRRPSGGGHGGGHGGGGGDRG